MSDFSLAEQFVEKEQQHEADHLGMWTFLATEILFFGALFATYTAYHFLYPEGFKQGAGELDVVLGTLNTGILLTSSLTMALAVHAAEVENRKKTLVLLALTCLLGTVFLGVKFYEYAHKYHEHLIPGPGFQVPAKIDEAPAGFEMFIYLYFFMTALHALHVVLGVLVLALLCGLIAGNYLRRNTSVVLEMAGLYWHFVDIVWIFLFPFLYLIGRSS
jgi:cytochrome c oxidase subunit 3